MVSPASLAATANPPLSYAERAKKAHSMKSSASQQPSHHSASQGKSSINPAAFSSSASRPSLVASPAALKPSGAPTTDSRIPPASAQPPSAPPSKATVSSSASDHKPNGDVNYHRDDSGPSAPSATSGQKQATAPPNVWNMRMEQMAARALTQSRSSLPSSSSTNHTMTSESLSPPPPSSLEAPAVPTVSASTSANMSVKSSPSVGPTSAANGHLDPSGDYDDPFVVKPGRSPSMLNISPPAIDDAENWPEVSQAAAAPPNGNNGHADGRNKEVEEKGHEREPSQGQGLRKSEKTKWLPVPPEELQFEGPARAQHARQRSQTQDRGSTRQGGTGSSSSGQGSQQQSRTHSAAGRRPTPSHAGSVSHSQAQSRTGSVHSSPRHASIRGGGRRLPDEVSGTAFNANRSMRSSGANSPSIYAQPQPLPIQEFIPGVRPYVNTSVTQGTRDALTLSAIHDSGGAELNPHAAMYHPLGPPFGVSPYHSPRPAGSPASNPYALPSMGYPGQPNMHPPVPMSGYGTPPYPMYSPYGYPYGQPYMYWPHPPGAPPPQATSSSPLVNAQPNDGIPPPSALARPLPPSESDAVAGYREIESVLSPPTERNFNEQGEDRGRRICELSFGSIGGGLEGTSRSPSPLRVSPVLEPVPEGAALGLDVSGSQPPAHAQVSSQVEGKEAQEHVQEEAGKGQRKDVAKSFTVFSIGVAPGEPGPAHLRSRTRTQSKSTAASMEPSVALKEGGHVDVPAEDQVAGLAVVAAQAIDLTDSETKWEFGTTKQGEGVTETGSELNIHLIGQAPSIDPSSPRPAGVPGSSFVPMGPPYGIPPYVPPVIIPGGPVNGMPSVTSPSVYAPPRQALSAAEDEWEVHDYGYGFGRGGPGSVYRNTNGPAREDRPFRGGRDFQGDRDQHYGRPRRGSYGQGGYGYERGSYGGRRGRGLGGGYAGRGYQNRTYSGRGGYSGQGQQRQPVYVPQPQPQPQLEPNGGYYAPPIAPIATYIPQAFEGYPYAPYPPAPPQAHTASSQGAPPAPLPMPQSNVGFPLDSTRYYLLGQLEYYLSHQNMVQDFFLRQQMDSRGWIPISLIASFNRVRSLTMDPQLVTEVLTLSSLLEVRGAYVRMREWQHFVLPAAAPSRIEDDENVLPQDPHTSIPDVGDAFDTQHEVPAQHEEHTTSQNHEGDDDEEEDVVFVL